MSTEERENRIDALLAWARHNARVNTDMVRAAWELEVPMKRLYAAAGAGLASYHKSTGQVRDDLRAALGADAAKLPQAYFDGYQLENLRAEYQLA